MTLAGTKDPTEKKMIQDRKTTTGQQYNRTVQKRQTYH